MSLKLNDDEINSFESGYKIKILHGPYRLFRIVSKPREGEKINKFGRYWFDESLFWESIDEATNFQRDEKMMNFILRRLLRELTAVSFDWNSFSGLCMLEIPKGKCIYTATGTIKEQPQFSNASSIDGLQRKKAMLFGGERQFIVDVTPEMKNWVKGPLPLDFRIGHA